MIWTDWAAVFKPLKEWLAGELIATRAELQLTRAALAESNRLLKLSSDCMATCRTQNEAVIKLLTAIEENTGKKNK